MNDEKLIPIIEALLLSADSALTPEKIQQVFEEEPPSMAQIRNALKQLGESCDGRGVELVQVASGYRFQARQDYAQWIAKLWEERPPRYSRALLETIALIAYRQPITRSEIEQVRGVSVSTSIVKTLAEREWIRIVGHRDVPGKPALYATTKEFLDYFGLKSLEELPSLAEIKDLESLNPELQFDNDGAPVADAESDAVPAVADDTIESESEPDADSSQAATDLESTADAESNEQVIH